MHTLPKPTIVQTVQEPNYMTDKASMTTYLASGFAALWGALTFEHVIGLIGILIAVAGLAVNVYYKHREDKRAHERHMRLMGVNPEE